MRYVIGLSFAALAVWILQATGILMAFFVFLAVGAVPGTSISVSPNAMLLILLFLAALLSYWLARMRPLRQVRTLRQAYHQQLPAEPAAQTKVDGVFAKAFRSSFNLMQRTTYEHRRRFGQKLVSAGRALLRGVQHAVRPFRVSFIVIALTTVVAARELAGWMPPLLRKAGRWLRTQINYSVKGTMLSAHRWSSLSKKAWSSAAPVLRRCSSLLKRGRSLRTRDARNS